MNRSVSVMSADESRRSHHQFHSPSSAWHRNLAMSYDQHFDVGYHQSAHECPPVAPCASFDFVPLASARIPNSVPSQAVFLSDCARLSCPSVIPDMHSCQRPEVTSASFYAHGTQTVSKPTTIVQGVPPASMLSSSSVEGDKCRNSADVNKNCVASMENCSRMPTVDLSAISPATSCDCPAVESSSEATVVACSNKTDVVTSVSGSVLAATAAPSSAAPRPMCGRAKTNAELKRQLMERREQRLRDMLDSSAESIVPSSTSSTEVSHSPYKQIEASSVVVS